MKVIGYVRVSTNRQETSPETQRAALAAWCESQGAELVSVHQDTISGSAEIESRPGLLAALDALPKGGVLLVTKRDRLARDPKLAAVVEFIAERGGARVVAIDVGDEPDELTAAIKRMVFDLAALIERHNIRARTTAVLATKRAAGQRVGTVRYGYALAGDRKTLVPDAAEQAVLARIRDAHARGESLRRIATKLNSEGLRTRRGSEWDYRDVRRLLDPERARDEARAYRARRRQGRAA